jgi:hypothetical protein
MPSKINCSDFCKLLTTVTDNIAKPEIPDVSFLSCCTLVRLDEGGQGLSCFIIFSFYIKVFVENGSSNEKHFYQLHTNSLLTKSGVNILKIML